MIRSVSNNSPSQMISVQISEGTEAILALADEWEHLVGDSLTPAPSGPCGHLAAIDALPPADVAVVAARDGGRLVGVLPLCRIRTDSRGLFLNLVGPPGRGDYQAFVIDPELVSQVLPEMLEADRQSTRVNS